MKYQMGEVGRIVVARFEEGEDIIENIIAVSKKENIKNAVFHLIGGIRQGRVVVGPAKEELPPEPVWKDILESHELLGTGTIFCQEDEPRVHFHGAFGKKDMVKVGCLRGGSKTFLVLEAVIFELRGINAKREIDQTSGLALLKL